MHVSGKPLKSLLEWSAKYRKPSACQATSLERTFSNTFCGVIVTSSTFDKMFENYTFFENTTKICIFFENRTKIYTFFENRFEIYTCILFENRTEILSMVDGLTINVHFSKAYGPVPIVYGIIWSHNELKKLCFLLRYGTLRCQPSISLRGSKNQNSTAGEDWLTRVFINWQPK